MTYDEWFRSKQGVPYEGAYVFAQDAWTYQGDTIAELRAELAESDALREKLAKLLAETAVALKGEEAALHRHSWHDLPVVALATVIELAEAKAEVDDVKQVQFPAKLESVSKGWKLKLSSLEKQRDDLLDALDDCRKQLSAWMRDHGDDIATQAAVGKARAAIAGTKVSA